MRSHAARASYRDSNSFEEFSGRRFPLRVPRPYSQQEPGGVGASRLRRRRERVVEKKPEFEAWIGVRKLDSSGSTERLRPRSELPPFIVRALEIVDDPHFIVPDDEIIRSGPASALVPQFDRLVGQRDRIGALWMNDPDVGSVELKPRA
jgi:hypothetical protein